MKNYLEDACLPVGRAQVLDFSKLVEVYQEISRYVWCHL